MSIVARVGGRYRGWGVSEGLGFFLVMIIGGRSGVVLSGYVEFAFLLVFFLRRICC